MKQSPDMENSAFIGKGWAFPPSFGNQGQDLHLVEGETEIEQSLVVLFSTRLGERVMHHSFGMDFDKYIFEGFSPRLLFEIEKMIRDAVDTYESRVELEKLDFIPSLTNDTELRVEVTFRIKGTNSRHNLVFPFSLAEGALYNQFIGI